jgi:hypothetical protein
VAPVPRVPVAKSICCQCSSVGPAQRPLIISLNRRTLRANARSITITGAVMVAAGNRDNV